MNWKRAALLPMILALASCSSEGSSRGSGISTLVQGNVVSVQAAPAKALPGGGRLAALSEAVQIEPVARAQTDVEGIRVVIEGTDVEDVTDANGNFSLPGGYEGDVKVVFELPSGDSAQIAVNAPAAGTLTLNDVHIDAANGEARAASQDVDFDGIITEVNCRDLTLTLVSSSQSPQETDSYTVRLETSVLQDPQGNPLTCGDLQAGEEASVRGVVNPDGSFGDATVVVQVGSR